MEAGSSGKDTVDAQVGRGPRAVAMLGLVLVAVGWYDGDGSGDWCKGGV